MGADSTKILSPEFTKYVNEQLEKSKQLDVCVEQGKLLISKFENEIRILMNMINVQKEELDRQKNSLVERDKSLYEVKETCQKKLQELNFTVTSCSNTLKQTQINMNAMLQENMQLKQEFNKNSSSLQEAFNRLRICNDELLVYKKTVPPEYIRQQYERQKEAQERERREQYERAERERMAREEQERREQEERRRREEHQRAEREKWEKRQAEEKRQAYERQGNMQYQERLKKMEQEKNKEEQEEENKKRESYTPEAYAQYLKMKALMKDAKTVLSRKKLPSALYKEIYRIVHFDKCGKEANYDNSIQRIEKFKETDRELYDIAYRIIIGIKESKVKHHQLDYCKQFSAIIAEARES